MTEGPEGCEESTAAWEIGERHEDEGALSAQIADMLGTENEETSETNMPEPRDGGGRGGTGKAEGGETVTFTDENANGGVSGEERD